MKNPALRRGVLIITYLVKAHSNLKLGYFFRRLGSESLKSRSKKV